MSNLIYRILNKPITFPPSTPLSSPARSIILSLCTIDRSHRLGNISGGASRVKAHSFFAGVRWDDVYHRKYRGPIIPPIRYAGDTQCFDTYPDERVAEGEGYTEEMREWWDDAFANF